MKETNVAEARVVLEEISEMEVRIRKTGAASEVQAEFPEEKITTLSDRDRDLILKLLANPPAPYEALPKLFAERRKERWLKSASSRSMRQGIGGSASIVESLPWTNLSVFVTTSTRALN